MSLKEIVCGEKSTKFHSNIFGIVIVVSFMISKFCVDYCVRNTSIYIQAKWIICRRKLWSDCRTHIISTKITVVYKDYLVIIFISTETLLAMLNMKGTLNLRPVDHHILFLLTIIQEWIFIQTLVSWIKIRNRSVIHI